MLRLEPDDAQAAIPWDALPPGREREELRVRAEWRLRWAVAPLLDDGLPIPLLRADDGHAWNERRRKQWPIDKPDERIKWPSGRRKYERGY